VVKGLHLPYHAPTFAFLEVADHRGLQIPGSSPFEVARGLWDPLGHAVSDAEVERGLWTPPSHTVFVAEVVRGLWVPLSRACSSTWWRKVFNSSTWWREVFGLL
jgi:hypothetical protein